MDLSRFGVYFVNVEFASWANSRTWPCLKAVAYSDTGTGPFSPMFLFLCTVWPKTFYIFSVRILRLYQAYLEIPLHLECLV